MTKQMVKGLVDLAVPENKVPIWNKINLTIEEAAEYSNIGINKIRELTKDPRNTFSLKIGNKTLIKRKAFENYIENKIEL